MQNIRLDLYIPNIILMRAGYFCIFGLLELNKSQFEVLLSFKDAKLKNKYQHYNDNNLIIIFFIIKPETSVKL